MKCSSPPKVRRVRKILQPPRLKKPVIPLTAFGRFKTVGGFTTKHFGVFLRKTSDLLARKNQREFLKRLGEDRNAGSRAVCAAGRFVVLNQVHGDSIAILERRRAFKKRRFSYLTATDGVITDIPGLSLLVMTADCLPVFFAAGDWVGLVHAGWRGTQKKISEKAILLLEQQSGVPASGIRVVFGPSIQAACYEVGAEFKAVFPSASIRERGSRFFFDLAGENRRQLLSVGVLPGHVKTFGHCTFTGQNDLYSFRREGEAAGRIISFIMKKI